VAAPTRGAGPRRDGELDVVIDPGRAELDVDGLLPAGGLAQFLDLDPQVIGAGPVRVPGRGSLVDAGRQRPHVRDPGADLLAEQHAPATRLGALPDHDIEAVPGLQAGQVAPEPRGQALSDPSVVRS